jgi:hypothetical protein
MQRRDQQRTAWPDRRRLVLSSQVHGGDYKFTDYYSVFSADDRQPLYLLDGMEFPSEQQILHGMLLPERREVEAVKDRLYRSFPYKQ